jgi:hypothetical protein
MLGCLVAIAHSIQDGLPAALARLGSVAAVAGITIGLILVTLDGLAAKGIAEAWTTAPAADQVAALQLVLAEETINFALAALFNILFAGVTFIFYGLAVAWSRTYPRWLGWSVVVAGAGSILAGLIQAAAGEPTTITRVLTIIFPTVITLWLVVPPAISRGSRGWWVSTKTGVWKGGSSPHQPLQGRSWGQGPGPPPNMLGPSRSRRRSTAPPRPPACWR